MLYPNRNITIRTGWGGLGMFRYAFHPVAFIPKRPDKVMAVNLLSQAIDSYGYVWSYRKTKAGIVWHFEKSSYSIQEWKTHYKWTYPFVYWLWLLENPKQLIKF